jgi:Cu/Zn superoxide dismutase
MKRLIPLALVVMLPLGLGGTAIADTPSSSSMPASLTVPIKAQNDSGEIGSATLTQKGSDVLVTLTLTGGSTDPQPAHIHLGTCAKLDPAPKYPLSNVADGKSVTTVKGVNLTDLETGAFAINVHKSTSDLKTYVACGDIPKAPTGST